MLCSLPRKRDPVALPKWDNQHQVPLGTFPPRRFNRLNWLLLTSAMLVNSYALAANLTIEPISHDFGSVNVDTLSGEKPFNIINDGNSSIQLGLIDVFGNVTTTTDEFGNASTAFGYKTFDDLGNPITVTEFQLTDACSNTELSVMATLDDPSARCELTFVFGPREVGTKELNISIPFNDEYGNPTSLTLPLTGKGVDIPIPNIGASITEHDFGAIVIGESSDIQTIKLFNTGEADLEIGSISISGDAGIDFGSDLCSGYTVSQDQFCSFKTQFVAQELAGEKVATLSVPSNDSDMPTLEIPLKGEAVDPPIPNIEVEAMEVNFGDIQVGISSDSQKVTVRNTGNAALEIGQITVSGDGFEIVNDNCSSQNVSEAGECTVTMKFSPVSTAAQSGTLSIPSNDPDTSTVSVELTGNGLGWCQGNYEQHFGTWPYEPNFGTELVGSSTSISQGVYSSARGCDALQIADVAPTGDNGDEFSVDNLQCYHGSWGDWSYSSCWFKTVFTPSEAGTKNAELTVTYTDSTTKTVPLQAAALDSGQPNISASPSSHDFGTVTAGSSYWNNYLKLTIKNTGNVNLHLGDFEIIGENADDFRGHEWSWCAYKGVLYPGEECDLYLYFVPRTAGSKQAELSIGSDAPNTPTLIALSGTAEEPKDCSDENITIESSGNDEDGGVWATRTTNNSWWQYTGDSDAWTRLKNPNGDNGIAAPNRPTQNDIVRIKAGHTIVGIPYANVRALCIEENATLKSMEPPDSSGYYYSYLGVYVSDFLENKGTIKGLHGTDETSDATSCSQWYNSSEDCARPGASINLSVGYYLGRFRNEGTIIAGNGGDGKQYGSYGGWVGIYGNGITNTDDLGIIRAGRGGSITGTQSGHGGQGGGVSIWGNDYLYSDGIGIFGGNGGNCNANASEAQYGGDGGNMRLNARNTVDLLDGTFATGKGGTNCEPLGEDGQDGGFNTDPSVLTLGGTNTKIEGGDLTIFGGEGWTINMNDLSDTALTATGDILIAVGPGGSVNMTGSSGNILKSGGKVTVLADNILLDDGVKLEDIVEAPEGVVVGPGQILRDVSVTAPNKVSGDPKSVVPVTITLSNGGPEEDTFLLSVTDSEGWTLSSLPATKTLAGLDSIQIDLNVTLPATIGAVDVITVSAVSQNDSEASAKTQIQVSVIEPVNGMAEIDEGVLNVPGIETSVNAGEVTIVSANGNIDLSNVGGNVVTATGNIILAVGPGGIIDLTGNNSRILETTGKVMICADLSKVKLDPGVDLSTLLGEYETCSSKATYAVALTGPGDLSKPAGSIVSLIFTLKNEGLNTDAYTISVTDSLGLPLTKLPSIKRLKGLASNELRLNVTMNSSMGETEIITVTATSQLNPSTTSTIQVRIYTTQGRTSTSGGGTSGTGGSYSGGGGGVSACPSTGVISGMCSSQGKVLRNVTINPGTTISGATLEGDNDNQGTVSGVTIEAGAVLRGGRISGNATVKGEMVDFEFVGGELVCEDGCQLSGNITNNSKVAGVFINPRFAANATIAGGILEGVTTGDSEGPATLTNLRIRKGSQVTDVILGEGVELDDDVTLINVRLAPNFRMKGGIAKGRLIGDPEFPAILEDTIILADCELSNVRISNNVQLAQGVQFKGNVRFTHSGAIPADLELIELLPELLGVPLEGILYPRRTDLSDDVLDPGEGVLSAINALSLFKDNGWTLLQNDEAGCLELTVDFDDVNIRACILPTSVKKAGDSAGFKLGDAESIYWTTETGLEVLTQPALQGPIALQSILLDFEIHEFSVQTNGNVRVDNPFVEGEWFSIRPNWWTLKLDDDAETGLSILDSPYISISLDLIFSDQEGNMRGQSLYPGVAYPELLYAGAEEVNIGAYGFIDFVFDDQRYCGVINYVVDPSTTTPTDTLQVEPIADLTGNGIDDLLLIYQNGDEQWMFGMPCD